MRKSPSGSIQAQRDRKKAYREQAGPVSNPGDGRERAKERRMNAERRVKARDARKEAL